MNRRPLSTFLAALLLIAVAGPASASLCDFDSVAIFATNSIRIGTTVVVNGNVVANNDSPGPFLDEGVELALDKDATINGDATAVSVDLDNGASVSGTLTCNTGDPGCSGLTPPVFQAGDLPAFLQANVRPGSDDVFVANGATVVLGAGNLVCSVALTSCTTDADCPAGEACVAGRTTDYGDIVVDQGGTLVFAGGGRFDVRSITSTTTAGPCKASGTPCRQIRFDAATELRVEGRFDSERGAYVGPSGPGIDGSDIAIYVAGQNGATGGLFELPRAANVGRDSEVEASFYAPNGTFELEKNSTMSGAALAANVQIDKDSTFNFDSAFQNKPPTADPKDAFTNGQVSIAIGLSGTDPEGQALTFAKASDPSVGSVSVAGATATYTNNPATDEETSFTYTATDECGATSAPATVRINPPGDPCVDDDDCDAGFFCSAQLICEPEPLGEVLADDQELESIEDTAITIILTGAAPCEGDCDGVGNDVPLTFSVPAMTSQGGSLSGLVQGTEVPRRSAAVLYTPPAGFNGADSFDFDVEGDLDNSGVIDPSAEPNPEIDTGTIDINVQAFTPPPPVVARDQRVSTPMNTPVIVTLSGVADETCRDDSECDVGEVCNVAAGVCEPAPALTSTSSTTATPYREPAVTVTDDTGAGVPPTKAYTRAATAPRPGTRLASPDEQLFAIDSDLDELFEIDPTSGGSTPVGSTAAGPGTPASLAFDGSDMYTIDLGGGGLYTLNLVTGAPTFVCSTGISGWQGLASDPTNSGQLYGITQSDDLYEIDRTTCATTRVNATAGTVGGLIAALEFDANGTLWGAEFGSPGGTTENAALVNIDKSTGAVTVVSQCATRPCTGSDNFLDGFQGIDFSTDGTLYGNNTNDDSLYIIDTTDGSLTFLGSNATIFVKGLAFSAEVDLAAGFTILTLPSVGTLSYLNPITGTQTDITSGDLPLLLVTEEVTYTPPTGATGDPLATFTYQQSDGLTSDTGTIELVVTGAIVVIDPCVAAGRPPGCAPEGFAAAESASYSDGDTKEEPGGTPNLRLVVEGKGSVATSRRETAAGSFAGLSCDDACGAEFAASDEVTLYARPVENSDFVRWQGDCGGSEPITTVIPGRGVTCVAVFEPGEEK